MKVQSEGMQEVHELSIQTGKDADSMSVNSEESLGTAGEFLRTIKALQKKIKKVFDPSRKSTYTAYKEVLKFEKDHLKPLEQAEKVIKSKILFYQQESETRRLALEAKKRKKADKEGLPFVPAPIPEKTEGVQTRSLWKYEITDISKIPKLYLVPNDKAIQAYASSMKGAASIPGVRFYEEKIIAAQAADIF